MITFLGPVQQRHFTTVNTANGGIYLQWFFIMWVQGVQYFSLLDGCVDTECFILSVCCRLKKILVNWGETLYSRISSSLRVGDESSLIIFSNSPAIDLDWRNNRLRLLLIITNFRRMLPIYSLSLINFVLCCLITKKMLKVLMYGHYILTY